MNNRIEQLDGIRGLAALSVFTQHLMSVSGVLIGNILLWTPLKIFYNGHAAVILFFVLSGFVLSIPFLGNKKVNYLPYLIRRIFRIYVPYLFAIFFSIGLKLLVATGNINQFSNYFNQFWSATIDFKIIMEHLLVLGNIHSMAINNVIWTLIQELRISLLFPFVVLLVNRLSLKMNVWICLVLTLLGGINNIFYFQMPNGNFTTYFDTFRYLAIFIFGALLAKHRQYIVTVYQGLSYRLKSLFLIFSLLIYVFADTITSALVNLITHTSHEFSIVSEYGATIGSIGIIVTSLGSVRIAKFLLNRYIHFLGRISYSLYLYHLPVVVSSIYIFYGFLPLWLIYSLSVVEVIVVSTLAWYLVENPSNKLGRELASKIKPKEQNLQEYKAAAKVQ